jgi:hypothetical protein
MVVESKSLLSLLFSQVQEIPMISSAPVSVFFKICLYCVLLQVSCIGFYPQRTFNSFHVPADLLSGKYSPVPLISMWRKAYIYAVTYFCLTTVIIKPAERLTTCPGKSGIVFCGEVCIQTAFHVILEGRYLELNWTEPHIRKFQLQVLKEYLQGSYLKASCCT